MKGYEGIRKPVSSCPDLKGCVGGGDTIEEAIADAEATKAVYLNYLKENEKEQCSDS